jgi:dolichol kinase
VSDLLLAEAIRAAAVATLFLAIFGVAESWRHLARPPPEWTRKLVHVGGGLVALALPWLVRSHWTVLALGALLGGVLLVTRRVGLLPSVHGVERSSEGAAYFPLAVYLVFLLAADRPILYLISVLALVVSDALAALVGTAYGRITYRVERDRRSIEGSAVFFLATFLAVHLPLLLLTGVERFVSVLVAIQIALLVTILEAVSVDGADNLIVPIGTYLLLLKLTPQSSGALLWQLAVQLAILGALFLLAWRLRMLTASGTLAASIFFYGAWGLGGSTWLVAPAVALAVFGVILRLAAEFHHGPSARFQVLAVFYTTLVPAAIFLLNDVMRTVLGHPAWAAGDPLLPLFVGAVAGQLALLCLVFWEGTPWTRSPAPARVTGSLAVAVILMLPAAYAFRGGGLARPALAVVAIPAVAVALYVAANRLAALPRERPWDGRLRAACVGAGALLLLPFLLPAGG